MVRRRIVHTDPSAREAGLVDTDLGFELHHAHPRSTRLNTVSFAISRLA